MIQATRKAVAITPPRVSNQWEMPATFPSVILRAGRRWGSSHLNKLHQMSRFHAAAIEMRLAKLTLEVGGSF